MSSPSDLLTIGQNLRAVATTLAQSGRQDTALPIMEQAYAAILMACSGLQVAVKFLPQQALPGLAHPEHLHVRLHQGTVQLSARDSIIGYGGSHLRRFPVLAHLCRSAASSLAGAEPVEFIFDIGDGADLGDYHRFAFCGAHSDHTLMPDPYFFESNGYASLRQFVVRQAKPWRQRAPILFWRGSASGIRRRAPKLAGGPAWDWLPRLQLCDISRKIGRAKHVDIALTQLVQIPEAHLRQAIIDAGFTAPPVDKRQFLTYRYLIDIDGNTGSWGWFDKMLLGATIVKIAAAENTRQWFSKDLTAWHSFVPVEADFSDFDDIVGWLLAHPEEAEMIAGTAHQLADDMQFDRVMLQADAEFLVTLMRPRRMPGQADPTEEKYGVA